MNLKGLSIQELFAAELKVSRQRRIAVEEENF
jgi:hypothetical protein